MKRLLILAVAAFAFACCNNSQPEPAKTVSAPVGCRSYFDVYGPVKTLQQVFEDGSNGNLFEFDEKGMEKGMLAADKEYLELNGMPESETTLSFDEEGRLTSFGIAGDNDLKYNGIYVEEMMENPTDLGPAYSPEFYVYDSNGDRIAKFFAKFEPNYSEDYKESIKSDPYLLYCDPNLLVTKVERYEILKRDDHGNWIERKATDNEKGKNSRIDKRIITYYE